MNHNFDDCLKRGLQGEGLIKSMFAQDFAPFLYQTEILSILFEKQPEIQKDGIDFIINLPPIHFEVKTIQKEGYTKWSNIIIETKSVIKNNKCLQEGWFYTTKSDVILYMYWGNEEHTKFIQGYLLFIKKIHPIFSSLTYPLKLVTSIRGNDEWQTEIMPIPISYLEKIHAIYPIKKDYNALLSKWFI